MTSPIKSTGKISQLITFLAILLAIALGSFVRLVHVIDIDFPLNDGGFFYAMVQDLLEAQFVLPYYASYNSSQIPYAYPPLPFYFAAMLRTLTNWEVLDIIRLLPALVSILTIPAFYILSRSILPSTVQAVFATYVFVFLPTSFDWLIVGGGLTRSFGFLFAILALQQAHSLYTSPHKVHIATTMLWASLTIFCHPGTAWFTLFSVVILMLFHFQSQDGWLKKTLMVLLGTFLLTSPWWGGVVLRYGWGTLLSPFQTENISLASVLMPFTFLFTNEPLLGILAFLGFLGLVISLRDRWYYLPVWLGAVFIFESRLGPTYSVLPIAMLAGYGIHKALLPITSRPASSRITKFTLGYLLIYALIAAFIAPTYQSVSKEQAETMQWIETHTPESSQFIVMTGTPEYGIDYISEWFPALSHRPNLTVSQGHEWLPNAVFNHRKNLHAGLQACYRQDITCIETWAESNRIEFSHILIARYGIEDQTHFLIQSLRESPSYETLHESPGGIVFARKTHLP